MNFKNNTFREIQELSKQYPDYSAGEVLYAGIRILGITKLSQLIDKTDEEIFTAFNRAIEEERDVTTEG